LGINRVPEKVQNKRKRRRKVKIQIIKSKSFFPGGRCNEAAYVVRGRVDEDIVQIPIPRRILETFKFF